MNHFVPISYRNTLCQLTRLQSSTSISRPKIRIPPRIEREPTAILNALESTLPKDAARIDHRYQDDCYLFPMKKLEYRTYALSYEAGRKAAMWIHREHSDLFPSNVSVPEIKAFKPPVKYTSKSQVSEEILLQFISEGDTLQALEIYNLLEENVSNETKQAFLELMCFYNETAHTCTSLPVDQWFNKPTPKMWMHDAEIEKLYQFLIKQDSATAAAAYNTMICALTKWNQLQEAWLLYQKCKKEDIPLNLTTYNYVIVLISELDKNGESSQNRVCDIFKDMNAKGIKPNLHTLNAALKVAFTMTYLPVAEHFMKYVFTEFKALKVKFSLASYYYATCLLTRRGEETYDTFMDILKVVSKEKFTYQHPLDNKFFVTAMYAAKHVYCSKEAGDMVHKIFLSNNNRQFITNLAQESGYYNAYTQLQLATSTIEEFFDYYEKTVPTVFIPDSFVIKNILQVLQSYPPEIRVKYLPKIWEDIKIFGYSDYGVMSTILHLMCEITVASDSPTRQVFADAADYCWNCIKEEMRRERYDPIETRILGKIVLLLLRNGPTSKVSEVLTYLVKHPNLFMPTMNMVEINDIFESCISEKCYAEALLLMEHAEKSGSYNIIEMAVKLYNISDIGNVCREALITLVGNEALLMSDKSASN